MRLRGVAKRGLSQRLARHHGVSAAARRLPRPGRLRGLRRVLGFGHGEVLGEVLVTWAAVVVRVRRREEGIAAAVDNARDGYAEATRNLAGRAAPGIDGAVQHDRRREVRAVLGQHELDEMLSERKKLSVDVQAILDSQTEIWGIKVSNVEIRTVELTENMVRAIAKQAEAERDRRAKIIHAEAEFQASQTLTNAAKILSSIPAAMQLRYLQTLTESGAEQNSTIVFPMPIDIIKPFLELMDKAGKPNATNGVDPAPDAPLHA